MKNKKFLCKIIILNIIKFNIYTLYLKFNFIYNSIRNLKYIGITKYIQDLYSENYITSLRKMKDLNKLKDISNNNIHK